ncbi:unnamed protein product [Caenorhabditis sp. 36 PRJEB53466]|nr:unnamed protein product [Caenorhabditis sp. 36 PRJEB53466]
MAFELRNEMSAVEIFDESRTSTEIKQEIAASKMPICEVMIETYYDFVHISVARRGKEYSGWILYDSDRLRKEITEPMSIGEERFEHSKREGNELILYHQSRFTGALSVLRFLFEVFTGPLQNVTLLTATTPNGSIARFYVDLFRLNSVTQCEKVLMFENGRSSKAMIDGILDLATGLKRLDLRCPLPDDWSNPKILKLDTLLSWPTGWFTTNDLLCVLDVECAQLNETKLDCRAFKAFMLKWQMTEDTRLKMLEISFNGNWEAFEHSGLEVKEWDPNERDSHYPDLLGKEDSDWQDCEFALDIQRKDGLLASFWRREHSFHFVVWHDRHPIATLRPHSSKLVKLGPEQFMSDEEHEDEDEDE